MAKPDRDAECTDYVSARRRSRELDDARRELRRDRPVNGRTLRCVV